MLSTKQVMQVHISLNFGLASSVYLAKGCTSALACSLSRQARWPGLAPSGTNIQKHPA